MPTILSLLSCSDSTRIPPYYSVFWSIRFPSVPPAVLPPTNSLSLRRSFLLPFVLSFVLLFPYSIHFKCFTIPFPRASCDHLVIIPYASRDHPAFFLCSLSPDHIRHLVFLFWCLSFFFFRAILSPALSLRPFPSLRALSPFTLSRTLPSVPSGSPSSSRHGVRWCDSGRNNRRN